MLHNLMVVSGLEFVQVVHLTLQYLQGLPERLEVWGWGISVTGYGVTEWDTYSCFVCSCC